MFALVYVYFTMDSLQRASITGQRLTETSSSPAVRASRIEHDVETKGTGSPPSLLLSISSTAATPGAAAFSFTRICRIVEHNQTGRLARRSTSRVVVRSTDTSAVGDTNNRGRWKPRWLERESNAVENDRALD